MKKRILALALAAIMLMVPFTACSSSSSSTPAASASAAGTGSSSTASAEPDNSPITITVLNRVNAEIVLDDNPMLAAVAEKTGVTLEIEAPPAICPTSFTPGNSTRTTKNGPMTA